MDLKNADFNEGLILPVIKPEGLTSFDVVRQVRKWTQCRKVGHTGTLDPKATGLLLICTGKATKQFDQLVTLEKVYQGVIELGKQTDTDDSEGKVIFTKSVPEFAEEEILSVLKQFEGEIEQTPPIYSALKIQGQPAYRLARKGKKVEMQPRSVFIKEIRLIQWKHPNIEIEVTCSRGTYIRAIARDVGDKLGVGGFLKSLIRTRIGQYSTDTAMSLDSLRESILSDEDRQIAQ
ncbi:tRNA pseudouridine(55) synthase TruB [candidate division KSB1 bacterium]|nr:tRNA pseudouridine(55) synthase TruB [candidate division KSB1 bacterium]